VVGDFADESNLKCDAGTSSGEEEGGMLRTTPKMSERATERCPPPPPPLYPTRGSVVPTSRICRVAASFEVVHSKKTLDVCVARSSASAIFFFWLRRHTRTASERPRVGLCRTHSSMTALEERFGPPPPSSLQVYSPMAILAVQFVVAVAVLTLLHPPFVCGTQGNVSVRTVVGIGLATTAICVIAHHADASDIVRGTFDTIKGCMIRS